MDSRQISAGELLAILHEGNRFDAARFVPWLYAGRRIGWILPDFAARLAAFSDVFAVAPGHVALIAGGDLAERSNAVNAAVWALRDAPGVGRWNDEFGLVRDTEGTEILQLARCATVPFGVRSFGSHVNGFVRRHGQPPCYWVARRHSRNSDFGGYYDTLAGGYIARDLAAWDVALREAAEEAGILSAATTRLQPTGLIRGVSEFADGVAPYGVFCFDAELPTHFTPRNLDGEVEDFELLNPSALLTALRERRFKFNAVPVIAHWLIRHGLVAPSGQHYVALASELQHWDPDMPPQK